MNKKFLKCIASIMAFMMLFASVALANNEDLYDGDDDDDDEIPIDVIKKDENFSQIVITKDKCVDLDAEFEEGFFDDSIYKLENGERKKVKVFAYYFTVEETGVYYWDGTGNVAVERWRVQLYSW